MKNNIPEIVFSYKNPQPQKRRIQLNSPLKLATYFRRSWDRNTIELIEEVKLLLLNQSLHVLGIVTLAKGGGCVATVDLRLLLASALKCNASSVALAHNHPSRNTQPSREDEHITYRVAKACEVVGVRFLEHVIITRESYSFIVPKQLKKRTMSKAPKAKKGDTVTFTAQDGSEKKGKIVEELGDNKLRARTPNKTIWRITQEDILSIE
jgi:hypothetical protein